MGARKLDRRAAIDDLGITVQSKIGRKTWIFAKAVQGKRRNGDGSKCPEEENDQRKGSEVGEKGGRSHGRSGLEVDLKVEGGNLGFLD